MFPLGTVLLPGMVLPLHVFEPRYRALVRDVRATDDRFGVVLIERGSEVGGGDTRTDVGTIAQVVQAEETPDGRWGLATVGVGRIRVDAWLDDDPYPRAEVTEWPEEEPALEPEGIGRLQALVRRTAALRTELGEPAPPVGIELVDDPALAVYQAAIGALPGPADRQRLLATPGTAAMGDLLVELLGDELALLEARLGGG
jgi:Lon protease-like protein